MSIKMLQLLEEPNVIKLRTPSQGGGRQKKKKKRGYNSSLPDPVTPTLAPLRSVPWKNFPDLLTSRPYH